MYAEILLDDLDGTLGDEHLQHLKTIRAKAQAAQELTKALVGFAAGRRSCPCQQSMWER
jgi:hypothetical protein